MSAASVMVRSMRRGLVPFVTCLLLLSVAMPTMGYNEAVYNGKLYGLVDAYEASLGSGAGAAEYQAERRGGHLATIDSEALNNWLVATFSEFTDGAYIGLYHDSDMMGPESDPLSGWQWAATGSSLPSYRNFAPGHPNTTVQYRHDEAFMRMSDGKWFDEIPWSPAEWGVYYPGVGIYQLDTENVSVVPITMNLPVVANASANSDWGINSAEAHYDEWDEGGASAHAWIDCYGGDALGGRIEASFQSFGGAGAGVQLQSGYTGTVTIGSTDDVLAGTPLWLTVDAGSTINGNGGWWELGLRRGADTVLSLSAMCPYEASESELLVYAGELLTVDWLAAGCFSGPEEYSQGDLVINMRLSRVVPEPSALFLLISGGLCSLGFIRRSRARRV